MQTHVYVTKFCPSWEDMKFMSSLQTLWVGGDTVTKSHTKTLGRQRGNCRPWEHKGCLAGSIEWLAQSSSQLPTSGTAAIYFVIFIECLSFVPELKAHYTGFLDGLPSKHWPAACLQRGDRSVCFQTIRQGYYDPQHLSTQSVDGALLNEHMH